MSPNGDSELLVLSSRNYSCKKEIALQTDGEVHETGGIVAPEGRAMALLSSSFLLTADELMYQQSLTLWLVVLFPYLGQLKGLFFDDGSLPDAFQLGLQLLDFEHEPVTDEDEFRYQVADFNGRAGLGRIDFP